MKKILLDSGPMIALFDASDSYHLKVCDFIKTNSHPMISTIVSITEALHMLDFNRNAQLDFLEWINRGAIEIHDICVPDFARIKELTKKHKDLPMDFADSCLVYLAEKYNLETIVTIDRDFTIYRINGKKKFKTILL